MTRLRSTRSTLLTALVLAARSLRALAGWGGSGSTKAGTGAAARAEAPQPELGSSCGEAVTLRFLADHGTTGKTQHPIGSPRELRGASTDWSIDAKPARTGRDPVERWAPVHGIVHDVPLPKRR